MALLDDIKKKLTSAEENAQESFTEKELLEALKLLEEEDYVVLNGNRKRPIVKLGGALK